MIDFDKLNAMVDEVNNVISDVKKETTRMNENTAEIIKDKFTEVNKILVNYYDIYVKSIGEQYSLETSISLGKGCIKFSKNGINVHFNTNEDRRDRYYNDYSICCENNDAKIKSRYDNLNKSHPSIIWFTSLIMVWDKFENEFDTKFTEQIHNILKLRSENAHKEYNTAQHGLEHYQNLI